MKRPAAGPVACFGKVPARGDFIRGRSNGAVVDALDQWLGQAMALLADSPGWKARYDDFGALDFAFLGPRRRYALAGRLAASRDQAGRRFPLLLVRTLETGADSDFLRCCPIAAWDLWRELDAIALRLRDEADTEAVLDRLDAEHGAALALEPAMAALEAFMNVHTIGTLRQSLHGCGYTGSVGALLLALGSSLRRVAGASAAADTGLLLPLPLDAPERQAVAAFYLSLIAPCLAGRDTEMALFLPHDRPVLLVGFAGASPRMLQALIDPVCAAACLESLADADLGDAAIAGDDGLRRLSCYLDQGQLPLASAHAHFTRTLMEGRP